MCIVRIPAKMEVTISRERNIKSIQNLLAKTRKKNKKKLIFSKLSNAKVKTSSKMISLSLPPTVCGHDQKGDGCVAVVAQPDSRVKKSHLPLCIAMPAYLYWFLLVKVMKEIFPRT